MNRSIQRVLEIAPVSFSRHILYSVYHFLVRQNYERELVATRKRVGEGSFESYDPLSLHLDDVLLQALLSNFESGESFFDVGANTGVYSLSVAANYPSSSIYAFEPDPVIFSRLTTNVQTNGFEERIEANNIGIGARTETLPFHRSTYPELGSFDRSAAARWGASIRETSPIPVRPIDEFVATVHSPPDHLKIDVEGHGLEVLEGARETIETHRPVVYFEFHPVDAQADRNWATRAFFETLDYRIESHDTAWICIPP